MMQEYPAEMLTEVSCKVLIIICAILSFLSQLLSDDCWHEGFYYYSILCSYVFLVFWSHLAIYIVHLFFGT